MCNNYHDHRKMSLRMIHLNAMICLIFLFCTTGYTQTTELELKAVALEKIALFIEWPRNEATYKTTPFVIAVLDEPEFGETLLEVYRNHKIKDRMVKVVNLSNISQLTDCQMLYLPEMKKSSLLKILDQVKRMPVLTIGDTEGYADAGCFVNFYNNEGKLRFEINQKAMKSAGFNVDYKLLRVAKVVEPVNL